MASKSKNSFEIGFFAKNRHHDARRIITHEACFVRYIKKQCNGNQHNTGQNAVETPVSRGGKVEQGWAGFCYFLSLVCHAFMCGCHDALHAHLRIHVLPRHSCVAFYLHTRKRQFRFMVKVDSVFKNKVAWGSQHVHFVAPVSVHGQGRFGL